MEICQAAQVRQIRREGARWGLHPVVKDGKVFVAQRLPVAHAAPGVGLGSIGERDDIVCELSDEMNAWGGVLATRIGRAEFDLTERAMAREAAMAKVENDARLEKNRVWYDRLRSTNRIVIPMWR